METDERLLGSNRVGSSRKAKLSRHADWFRRMGQMGGKKVGEGRRRRMNAECATPSEPLGRKLERYGSRHFIWCMWTGGLKGKWMAWKRRLRLRNAQKHNEIAVGLSFSSNGDSKLLFSLTGCEYIGRMREKRRRHGRDTGFLERKAVNILVEISTEWIASDRSEEMLSSHEMRMCLERRRLETPGLNWVGGWGDYGASRHGTDA
ncbi:hypothetical protein BJ508DRAFT_315342 [Ascobolus immersus RN42]|uniref:Uncharacterized protein n=1 Tax=Ascobolus immersus RN42 TaxID=1160509 RepID=A0A3N4HBB4_ASCIM|nr:hypothetical protein BJ508DRAFT_315342 [Ascobolus immersus RN42]